MSRGVRQKLQEKCLKATLLAHGEFAPSLPPDWSCEPPILDGAYVTQQNPPWLRNTEYTARCRSGLIVFNDATSTSFKIKCGSDLEWENPEDWPRCVESEYFI